MDKNQDFKTTNPDSIIMNVKIPFYEHVVGPYSQLQSVQHKQLLEFNGVSTDSSGLISGTHHSAALLREASFYLLAETPEESLREIYLNGIDDTDPAVKSLSAYGLVQLGDSSKSSILDSLSLKKNNPGVSIFLTAALRGKIGDGSAFPIIESGVNDSEDYIQLIAMSYAHYFFEISDTIDYWKFYQKAVKHKNERVRLIARMQLEEFDTESSRRILEDMK